MADGGPVTTRPDAGTTTKTEEPEDDGCTAAHASFSPAPFLVAFSAIVAMRASRRFVTRR